jgi:hypothetical protein
MNVKVLTSLAAAVVVTSLAQPVIAESLGDHPAVLVSRAWSNRGIDPNTFIVQHPAGPVWVNASPKATDKLTGDPASRMAKAASTTSK